MNQVTEAKIGDGIWHVARAFIKAPGFGPGKEVLFTSNKILKRPDGKALTGSFGHINVRPDDTEKGLIDMLARATGHKAKDIRLELVESDMGPFERQVESVYSQTNEGYDPVPIEIRIDAPGMSYDDIINEFGEYAVREFGGQIGIETEFQSGRGWWEGMFPVPPRLAQALRRMGTVTVGDMTVSRI